MRRVAGLKRAGERGQHAAPVARPRQIGYTVAHLAMRLFSADHAAQTHPQVFAARPLGPASCQGRCFSPAYCAC